MNRQDLTTGPVFSTMSLFALPMILGNILQQGYNIADTWVVGHMIGPDALAAVGSAFALMTFLTSVREAERFFHFALADRTGSS